MKKPLMSGVDVAKYQGDFDFEKAKKEGFKFAILKGAGTTDSGATYEDRCFENNYKKAKTAGVPVGCYFFSQALTVTQAREEAKYFYDVCLKGKQFELPVYMDVEDKEQFKLGKDKLTDVVEAFCEYLEKLGFWVGVYASKYTFAAYLDDARLQKYTHWVAQYNTECTYPKEYADHVLGLWQYGGSTNKIRSNKVAGVVCDQNYLYIDFPKKIKAAGLNGFKKETPPPKVREFKMGDKVKIKPTTEKYATGEKIPTSYKNRELTVREGQSEDKKGRVLIAEVFSYVWPKDLIYVPKKAPEKKPVKVAHKATIKDGAIYGGADYGKRVPSSRIKKKDKGKNLVRIKYTIDSIATHGKRREAYIKSINSWIPIEHLEGA